MFYRTKLALAKLIWKHQMGRASIAAAIKIQEKHGGYVTPLIFKQAEANYAKEFVKVRHLIMSDEEIKEKSIRQIIRSFPIQPNEYHNAIIRDYWNIEAAIQNGVQKMQ